MKKGLTPAVVALVTLFAGGAGAATLDPALEEQLAGLRANDRVDVIVRCADRVAKGDYAHADRRLKRRKLVKALKAKASICQKLVAKGRAVADDEGDRPLWLVNSVAATLKVKRIRQLAGRKGVDSIYPNRTVELPPPEPEPPRPVLSGQPGDPPYTFWNLSETRITDLWALGHYGLGVVVGTLDTGVDPDHADLAANWRGGANSWFDPSGEHATPFDADGHGTGVMGLILGGNSTGFDLGAAPGAQWIAAKLFDDAGSSDLARIHQAFQWMLDPDGDPLTDDAPHIVNNSWVLLGTEDQCLGEFANDIALLNEAGIAVVFSAGNFGPGAYTSMEPANNSGSTAVGSVDFYRDVSLSSSRGPSACGGGVYPHLVAPGEGVYTTGLTSSGANPSALTTASGTSAAAPHVAGAIAVLMSAAPGAPREAVEAAIREGALDLGPVGPDDDSGAGYLDAVEAFLRLSDTGDADGDGVTADLDCDDADPLAYPGAPEIRDDGVDQDCNGYDLTIAVTRAAYLQAPDELVVWSTSALGDLAALQVLVALADGGSIERPLAWNAVEARWELTLAGFAAQFGTPVSVTVSGPEGSESAPVDQEPGGPADADGDGVTEDLDCDDGDPLVYPGAPEVNGDGIDQDCNGYDMSLAVTRARYLWETDKLVVWSTSALGEQAVLRMLIDLEDGSSVDRPMTWNAGKARWQRTLGKFSANLGIPVSVTVYGPEGSATLPVERFPDVAADADGDGVGADLDCDDGDPSVYPGAPEVNGDGIDQDCNGYDLSIAVTRAGYRAAADELLVWATSALGEQAALAVQVAFEGGGSIDRPLSWDAAAARWETTIADVTAQFGIPLSVTVSGPEGSTGAPVEQESGGPADNDGDGVDADLDCDDGNPSVYPGAPEVNGDGIDQDCNGMDLTIEVTRAWYLSAKDRLVVWSTSALGDQAALRVAIALTDGADVDRKMTWNASKGRWQKVIGKFSVNLGVPEAVTVYGPEGAETLAVEQR